MATGPVKSFIAFSDAELNTYGGSTEAAIQYFQESCDAGIQTFKVCPLSASAKCDLTPFLARSSLRRGAIAADWTGCWGRADDAQPAWLLVTATARGVPFAELRIDVVQKVTLPDLSTGAKLPGVKYSCTGDEWAGLCGHESAAHLVAAIKAEYDVDDETPLMFVGFKVRPGGAAFNRVTQEDVDAESELEGD